MQPMDAVLASGQPASLLLVAEGVSRFASEERCCASFFILQHAARRVWLQHAFSSSCRSSPRRPEDGILGGHEGGETGHATW